jgi:hypothetical protein
MGHMGSCRCLDLTRRRAKVSIDDAFLPLHLPPHCLAFLQGKPKTVVTNPRNRTRPMRSLIVGRTSRPVINLVHKLDYLVQT